MASHRRHRLVRRAAAEAPNMSRPATPSAPPIGFMVAVCVCVASALIVAFTGGLVIGMHHACDTDGQRELPAVQRQA